MMTAGAGRLAVASQTQPARASHETRAGHCIAESFYAATVT